MPPKSTVNVRKVQPKGTRKPAVRSFVATSGGSRNAPTLKRVDSVSGTSSAGATGSSQEYVTLQQVVLEEYEFEQQSTPLQSRELPLSSQEEAELIAQLPENPEDLTTPLHTSSGKVINFSGAGI
jgi:hypothetical protein